MKEKVLSPKIYLNIFFIIVVSAILTTTYFSYKQIDKILASSQSMKHTYEVIQVNNNILFELLDAESAARGYVISGEHYFIRRFDDRISSINNNYLALTTLIANNPQQQILVKMLEPLLKERIIMLNKLITLKTENKKLSSEIKISVESGQELTLSIKNIIREIYNNELNIMQKKENDLLWNYRWINILTNAFDIINILLLIIIIILFNKMLSKIIQSQKKVEQSESLLNGIIDGSKDFIAALDLKYNLLSFNNAFAREFRNIFGKSVTIGMNLIEAIEHLPVEQEKAKKIWSRALSGELFTVVEKFGSTPETQHQYEINYSPIYNEQNQLIGAAHIARDVENRIDNEMKLINMNEQLENSLTKMEEQAKEMSIINDMNNRLGSSISLKETIEITAIYFKKIFPFISGALYLINPSHNYLEILAQWNESQNLDNLFTPEQCWGLRQGKIYCYINNETNIPCSHLAKDTPLSPYLCIPLLASNEVIGLLYLHFLQHTGNDVEDSKNFKIFYDKNNNLLQNLAGQIALSISNIRLHEVLKMRSTRDLLTNLYNRSYLTETFERDIQRTKRNKSSMAVVMMDLDFFKRVNDEHGHEAGDTVLRKVSQTITHFLRKSDIACRYGGEEILIILYDTDIKDAVEKMERLRVDISNLEFRFGSLLTITASFGIAMFPEDGETAEALLQTADAALYYSKKTGRNKVTVFRDIVKNNNES